MFFKKKENDEVVLSTPAGITASGDKKLVKNIEFMSWIQEFSKKIVVITFFIFIIMNLFFLIMIIIEFYMTSEIIYFDTLISEIHNTFREVVGGYIVKAAVENVIKISGGYMESYISTKTTIIEKQMLKNAGLDVTKVKTPANQDDPEGAIEE